MRKYNVTKNNAYSCGKKILFHWSIVPNTAIPVENVLKTNNFTVRINI